MADYEKTNTLAVDLDGTLAERQSPFNPLTVGDVIPAMLSKVKAQLAKGRKVVLFTARASTMDDKAEKAIKAWLKEHGLEKLEITCTKTPDITEFWDDRARGVKVDEGHFRELVKDAFRRDRLQRLWARKGLCPKCGGKPENLDGFFAGGALTCSTCSHNWLIPTTIDDSQGVKQAKEIVRKEVPRTDIVEHCPHCDHQFVEKGGPRLKREEGQPWEDCEYECPVCHGEIWMPLPSDEDLENLGTWLGGSRRTEYIQREKDCRERKRAQREAKQAEQTKQASTGAVKPTSFLNTLQRRAGGVQHLPVTPPAPVEGYRNRDGSVLPAAKSPQSWSPVMALKPAYGDKWDASLQAARDYRAKNPDIKYMSQLSDEALNTATDVNITGKLPPGTGGYTDTDTMKVDLAPAGPSLLRHEMRHVTQLQGKDWLDREIMSQDYDKAVEKNDAAYLTHPMELEARLPELNAAWVRRGGQMPRNPEEAMQVLRHYSQPGYPWGDPYSTDWRAPDYTRTRTRSDGQGGTVKVTPEWSTPGADYKELELEGADENYHNVAPIFELLRRARNVGGEEKRQQLLDQMAKMLPGLVASPFVEGSQKAASSLEPLLKKARPSPPTSFSRPENWDAEDIATEGCKLYCGANDWESGHTWMWVVRKSEADLHGDLVWVAINNPLGRDDSCSSTEAAEAKKIGQQAVEAWIAAAKTEARKNLPPGDKGLGIKPGYWDFLRALQHEEVQKHVWASGELKADPRVKKASLDPADVAPSEVVTNTGPMAIYRALKALDPKALKEAADKDVKSGKITRRDKAVKILQVLDGLQRTGVAPHQLMIKKVPVIPPQFRPYATMGDSLVPGAANELYQDLMRNIDLHKRTTRTLGDAGATLTRRNLLASVRAAYGYGDPVSPKLQGRGTKGFLQQILGDSPKFGFVQRRLLSKPIDSVGRGVITVNPDLDMNQISLPEDMAWELYGSHVQRRLVQRMGMSPGQAFKALADRTPEATNALKQEMTPGIGRPVIYSRAPAWHKFNTVSGWPLMHKGTNIAINPYVTAGLNADFNGDQCIGKIMVIVPKTVSANNRSLYLQSRLESTVVATMIRKSIIPAFDTATHTLHLVDLEEFPHGPLQRHKTNGKNGEIFFYHVDPGVKVVAFGEQTGQPVWADVAFYSVHPQRVVELVDLANGRQIYTDDDPRAVYGVDPQNPKWELTRCTPTEALERRLVVPCIKNVAAACQHLESVTELKLEGTDRTFKLDWDLGWLLGAIAGDGWWDKRAYQDKWQVYLADLTGFNAARMLVTLRRMFGKVSHSTQAQNKEDDASRYGDTVRHTFLFAEGEAFCKFLSFWLGGSRTENSAGSATKSLPDIFLLAPREFREGLLCGVMDTDGSVSVSNAKGAPQLMCAITSTSIRLASDIKFLALTLGITSSLSYSKTTIRGNTSWIVTLSAPDCKKHNVFARLAAEYKRDNFLNTAVSESNTSLVFDKVVVPANVWARVAQDLSCPKIRVHERKPGNESSDLTDRKRLQSIYQTWYQAQQSHTIARSTFEAVMEYLQAQVVKSEDTINRAIRDLESEDDRVTLTRVELWRAAVRCVSPSQDTKERYSAGCGVYAKFNRPLREGVYGLKARLKVAAWLRDTPRYLYAHETEMLTAWKRFFLDQDDVSWAVVTGVQKTGIKEDGYDLTVPGYETFMSADGVILSNTINVNVPVLPDTVEEARTKLLPSNMKFSIRNEDQVMGGPKHEQVLGLYTASSRSSGKVHQFNNRDEAMQAVEQGKVAFDDELEFPD